jgi:molybdate transport system substrate-binding protein
LARWIAALIIVTLGLPAVACGPRPTTDRAQATAMSTAASGELTVFAAASLTDAFAQIGRDFEAEHPAVAVTFSFAGSQQLATQIVNGAPADVFASASPAQMEVVADARAIAGEPVIFATNRLEIAVEPGNPRGVADLEDLARTDLKVVLAAEEVPAGQYAREALDAAGVAVTPVSLETDVRAVLSKVALGEVDVGIVYASDIVAASDGVASIEIPHERNIVASYPIARVTAAPNPHTADAFVAYLAAERARTALRDHGFSAP